jgi:hypothetical protein
MGRDQPAFSISQNPRSDSYANAIRNFRELPCDDAKSLSPLTACQSRRGFGGRVRGFVERVGVSEEVLLWKSRKDLSNT